MNENQILSGNLPNSEDHFGLRRPQLPLGCRTTPEGRWYFEDAILGVCVACSQLVKAARRYMFWQDREQVETNDENSFVGFIGLVGKEPDVERGLLVDTGASINIHG